MIDRTNQYCTFWVGGYLCGVPVQDVQEVLCGTLLTPIPLAPKVIVGLMNLRGQIVMAIDLRRRLELPNSTKSVAAMNVILRTPDGLVSFLVDRVGDVITVDREQIDPVPANLDGIGRELVFGTVQLEPHLLLLLKADRCAELQSVFDMRKHEEALP